MDTKLRRRNNFCHYRSRGDRYDGGLRACQTELPRTADHLLAYSGDAYNSLACHRCAALQDDGGLGLGQYVLGINHARVDWGIEHILDETVHVNAADQPDLRRARGRLPRMAHLLENHRATVETRHRGCRHFHLHGAVEQLLLALDCHLDPGHAHADRWLDDGALFSI